MSTVRFFDMIRKGDGEKAGHKYQSRKPDGKGGWIYDYGQGHEKPKEGKHAHTTASRKWDAEDNLSYFIGNAHPSKWSDAKVAEHGEKALKYLNQLIDHEKSGGAVHWGGGALNAQTEHSGKGSKRHGEGGDGHSGGHSDAVKIRDALKARMGSK